jgi:hypothetical protein
MGRYGNKRTNDPSIRQGTRMKNLSKLVFILVIAIIVGGGLFLATWDIPAPVNNVERTLPDNKFPN